jgi:hypothetical protein
MSCNVSSERKIKIKIALQESLPAFTRICPPAEISVSCAGASHPTPLLSANRVRRIHNYYFCFEANLRKNQSYSLHIRIFRYICKHHLFASLASYSLQNCRTDLHTNVQVDAKNTYCSEYSLQNKYSLQSKYSLKILSYWRIFASKY